MNKVISGNYLITAPHEGYEQKTLFFCFQQSAGYSCIQIEKGIGIIKVSETKEIQHLGKLQEKTTAELIALLNEALTPASTID